MYRSMLSHMLVSMFSTCRTYSPQEIFALTVGRGLAGGCFSDDVDSEQETTASERERIAADAERELMDWRKAQFMADRVGEEFDGFITGVKEYGFYVELEEFFVEGLVHVSTLLDDSYEYQERKHRLIGQRTRAVFRLGDRVRIAVNRVDRARHLIDFSVV